MCKHKMVNHAYLWMEKQYPGEFPQVCYADESRYDSKHVRCPMAEGGRGMLTLQLLLKQFHVYLCCLFEHTTKHTRDKFAAMGLYHGLRELKIGESNYSPSVATARSEQSRL